MLKGVKVNEGDKGMMMGREEGMKSLTRGSKVIFRLSVSSLVDVSLSLLPRPEVA